MILPALREFLLDDAAVAAILGDADEGVYEAMVPQKRPRPYVVLHLIGGPRAYHHGGPSAVVRYQVQIESWADTRAVAVALAAAVEDALSGFSGALTSTVWVQCSVIMDERGPLASDLQDGGQDPAFSVQTDYGVTAHRRAA